MWEWTEASTNADGSLHTDIISQTEVLGIRVFFFFFSKFWKLDGRGWEWVALGRRK